MLAPSLPLFPWPLVRSSSANVKMWKNTRALCPRCPCAPQPVTVRASSPQPPLPRTYVSGLPYTPWGAQQPPNPLAGADFVQSCRDPSLGQTSGSHTVPALPVPSMLQGDMSRLAHSALCSPDPFTLQHNHPEGHCPIFYMAWAPPLCALTGAAAQGRSWLFPLLGPAGASQAPPGRFGGFLPPLCPVHPERSWFGWGTALG